MNKRVKRVLKIFELAFRRLTLLSLKIAGGNRAAQLSSAALTLSPDPKILFLRQDRIGDAIITTPLLVAVRTKYPNAKITFLLSKNNRAIIPLLPIDCDTVIYQKSWLKDRAMLRLLRKQKFDVAIDMTDNASVTSSILMASIKPRFAIGIEKENAVVYDVLVPRIDREKNHISARIAELLRPLGIDPNTVNAKPQLRIKQLQKVAGRLGINISAGTESRWAPETVYAEIAKQALQSKRWNEVAILAEPRDEIKAIEIEKLAGDARIQVMPVTGSYGDFASSLSTCEALISPDTSVVHLAAALDLPQVVIYAPIPKGLHYWTPIGVPYEMIVQSPSLATLEPHSVISLLRRLEAKLGNATPVVLPREQAL
ncbi:MAG TPA: glycosyltransferase family 9 protein [Candidatus Kapabacteria bacterium]|nr:glycosyltransferase family 9 protein [Candidatus Kapabacteria bacterium]